MLLFCFLQPLGIDPMIKHHQVDILLNKITHAEGENEVRKSNTISKISQFGFVTILILLLLLQKLKREMDEAERRIEQLTELRRAGQVSTTCYAKVVFCPNSVTSV